MSINYSEAAYFDGNHCQHVADRDSYVFLADRRKRAVALYRGLERRRPVRAN